jgi:glycosyltransferase involved in cell wall biosynthesis
MNRALTVQDLPPPPPGRTGWPWTEASPALPIHRRDGSPWPMVSVVSPSFNQADYLEETIRSILLQSYPNLEYVIMDGGSSDRSIKIIEKYASFLTYWVSQKDGGQSQAINQGFTRTSGEILAWLNSDDVFEPGALKFAVECLSAGPVWMTGASQGIEADGRPFQLFKPQLFQSGSEWVRHLLEGNSCCIPQTSTFWRKEAWVNSGPLNEKMNYALDHDFFMRLYRQFGPPAIVDQTLSRSRIHPACKSAVPSTHFAKEIVKIGLRHTDLLSAGQRWLVPFRVRRIHGRQALYEAIELADQKMAILSTLRFLKALVLWPSLAWDRMLIGFLLRRRTAGLKWRDRAREHKIFLQDLLKWITGQELNSGTYTKFVLINRLRRQTKARVFIETGTLFGETSRRAAAVFERVVTIELDKTLADRAALSLRDLTNVEVLQGDALEVLPIVLKRAEVRDILVFLDGHFSGEGTAQGELPEPALAELRILANVKDHVNGVIVDDFRSFGVEPGFPTKSQLLQCAETCFPEREFTLSVYWDQLWILRRL